MVFLDLLSNFIIRAVQSYMTGSPFGMRSYAFSWNCWIYFYSLLKAERIVSEESHRSRSRL